MTTLAEKLIALVAREYEAEAPQLTNCATHAATKITERDIDCSLCASDVRTMVLAALKANEWLCGWQEDAKTLIAEAAALIDAAPTLKSEPDAADPNRIPDDELRAMHRESCIPVAYDDGTKITVGTMAGGAADPEAHMMDGPLTLSLHIENDGKGHPVDYLRTSTFTPALLTKLADLVRSALIVDDHEVREEVTVAQTEAVVDAP